jgi:hypothetical protein
MGCITVLAEVGTSTVDLETSVDRFRVETTDGDAIELRRLVAHVNVNKREACLMSRVRLGPRGEAGWVLGAG